MSGSGLSLVSLKTETPETKPRVPGQVVLSVGLFSFNRTTKNQKRVVSIFPLKNSFIEI